MPLETYAFQTAMRSGAMDLLIGYKAQAGIKLQTYPGRPLQLYPPCAFPDAMGEDGQFYGPLNRIRTVRVGLLCLWGEFDSGEAVAQRDAFVDGFGDYFTDHRDIAGAATALTAYSIEDIPVYNPDWGPELQRQISYYATRITLEGQATV